MMIKNKKFSRGPRNFSDGQSGNKRTKSDGWEKLSPGDVVLVFTDHPKREHLEGQARLIRYRFDDPLLGEYWMVEFLFGLDRVERWVLPRNKVGTTQYFS